MLRNYRELVISAIIVFIYVLVNNSPQLLQLILCLLITGIVFSLTSYQTQVIFLLCTSIPKFAEVGSGVISGINLTTILLMFFIPIAFINVFKRINRTQIKLFVPIFIFSIYHFFSLSYGFSISEFNFSSFYFFKNLRDILIFIVIFIYLLFLPMTAIRKYEITNIFIFVCIIGATYELFESLRTAYYLGSDVMIWTQLKEINVSDYTFGIEPVFYLIPLNLILSMLLNLDSHKYRKVHMVGIVIIILAILFSLQRTIIILAILNIIVLTFPKLKKNPSVTMLLLIITIPLFLTLTTRLLPIISMINETFTSATASNIYGIKIDTSGRWDNQWPFAIETWKKAPYFGIGHSQMFLVGWWNKRDNNEKTQGQKMALNTHNVYLEYMAQGGLLGLIFVIWFCYKISKILFQNSRDKLINDKYYSTMNGALFYFWIVFLFTNILNSYFWTSGTLLPFIILYTLWGNKA